MKTHDDFCPECGRSYKGAKKTYDGLLFFICNILPGAGYMYLGLLKRGMAFMAAFFGIAFLAGEFRLPFLGIAFPIIYAVSFFDGLKKMRALNGGFSVNDDVDDMKEFFYRHRGVIAVYLIICGAHRVLNILGDMTSAAFYRAGNWLPVLLVAAGIILLAKRRKRRAEPDDTREVQ